LLITLGIAAGGFRTFSRWKREKIEERRIEVAVEMLSIAYESRYVFGTIRSPATFPYETEDMPVIEGESESQRSRRGPFYATLKLIEHSKDFFERAWKLQPRCAAVFGRDTDEIFLLMHRARREIEASAQMLLWDSEGVDRDTLEEWRRDVWDLGDRQRSNDQVGQKLIEFTQRTETLCRPIVDRGFREARRGAK
jgi:hypothetical protein